MFACTVSTVEDVTVKPLMFACTVPIILRTLMLLCQLYVVIVFIEFARIKDTKIILHVKLSTFRTAKLTRFIDFATEKHNKIIISTNNECLHCCRLGKANARIHLMNADCQVDKIPQTNPADLVTPTCCLKLITARGLLPSTSTITICCYYSVQKLILILPYHGGRRENGKTIEVSTVPWDVILGDDENVVACIFGHGGKSCSVCNIY